MSNPFNNNHRPRVRSNSFSRYNVNDNIHQNPPPFLLPMPSFPSSVFPPQLPFVHPPYQQPNNIPSPFQINFTVHPQPQIPSHQYNTSSYFSPQPQFLRNGPQENTPNHPASPPPRYSEQPSDYSNTDHQRNSSYSNIHNTRGGRRSYNNCRNSNKICNHFAEDDDDDDDSCSVQSMPTSRRNRNNSRQSHYKKDEFRVDAKSTKAKKDHDGGDDDDDSCSAQSMPTGRRSRNKIRRFQEHKNGKCKANAKNTQAKKDDMSDDFNDDDDSSSVRSMPTGKRNNNRQSQYNRRNKGGAEAKSKNDEAKNDVDDTCSVQSMATGKKNYNRRREFQTGKKNAEAQKEEEKIFVDDDNDSDHCSIRSMPLVSMEFKRGGLRSKNIGGRDCGYNESKRDDKFTSQPHFDRGHYGDKGYTKDKQKGTNSYRNWNNNKGVNEYKGNILEQNNGKNNKNYTKNLQNDKPTVPKVGNKLKEAVTDNNEGVRKEVESSKSDNSKFKDKVGKECGGNSGSNNQNPSIQIEKQDKSSDNSSSGNSQRGGKKNRDKVNQCQEKQPLRTIPSDMEDSSSLRDDCSTGLENLKVSIKLNFVFEDTVELKNAIKEAFSFPNANHYEIQFVQEAVLYAQKLSTCEFYIVTSNIPVARKCVKSMVGILRKKVKTFIHYTMYVDRKRPMKKHSSKEMHSRETVSDAKQNFQLDVVENAKGKLKSSETDLSKPVQKLENLKQKDGSQPVPVLVKLSIEKQFTEEKFREFIDVLVKEFSEIESFEVKENFIVLTDVSSQCSIRLKSKADSKQLKAKIDEFGKDTDVKFQFEVVKDEEDTKYDTKKHTKIATQIEETLRNMESRKDFFLSNHEKKISSLKEKIESILKMPPLEANEAEINALEDKLLEAHKQKTEFLCMCQSICNNMNELRSDVKKTMSDLIKLQNKFGIECQRLASGLPIYARREDIVNHIASNQVSIVLGETGSGKSTQLVQYIYDSDIKTQGLIVCTQPRKVAAVQLAERVAQEMTENVGGIVGFKSGSRRKISDKTKIVYMTDHALLNECLLDKDFKQYNCIIVDEAHERSIYTDILLGMIKQCLPNRPDLKVIITSATINPKVFIEYFQCPEEIKVSGRTYPVEVFYSDLSDDFENYEVKAVSKAAEIHNSEPEGDILIFLTSAVEIQRCCEEFSRIFTGRNDFQCLPLHGQLPPEEQKRVFKKLDAGVRKVVFATNCAETSITIDGIKYVVDSGVSKEMRYDAKKNLNLLGVHVISKSSADQRKGRAGRTAAGKCYRLFSEKGLNSMSAINEPEILRVHLGQAILKLAELGVNICDYEFVDAPSDFALKAALDTLKFLGAINNQSQITQIGRWISKLPFDPKLGYVVYKASFDNLIYDALVLAAVVNNGSGLFYRGFTETEAQVTARTKNEFGLESGDVFTWYSIYRMWLNLPTRERSQWCKSKCINYKNLSYIQQCVKDSLDAVRNDLQVNVQANFSDVKTDVTLGKMLFFAFGQSLCHFMGHSRAGYFSLSNDRQVHIHPSCTLAAQNIHPEWLVFTEAFKISREFIKGILVVQEDWIQEAIDSNHLDVDITKAKEKTLQIVYQVELGNYVFRDIVGARYSNLQSLEDLCEDLGMKHSIIEADRNLGLLSVYSSNAAASDQVVWLLQEMKTEIVKRLSAEQSECKIFDASSKNSPNVRVVLGKGADVIQVLMPDQTNCVLIWKVGELSEEEIREKFSKFGEIIEIVSFKSNEPWGFVRYQSIDEAVTAVENTSQDPSLAASLKLEKSSDNTRSKFEAKVSWMRRPVKGTGTAFIKCDAMDRSSLIGRNVFINGNLKTINVSKKERENKRFDEESSGPDLVIFKTGEVTQEEIRDELLRITCRVINAKITIPREQKDPPTQEEVEELKMILRSKIDPYEQENFTIWLNKPRRENIQYTAFLYFADPLRGLQICNRLSGILRMDGQCVKFAPCLKTTIVVPKKIKSAVKDQIDEVTENMQRDLHIKLVWKSIKEDHAVVIESDNPVSIVKARECIAKELNGEMIDCNVATACLCFFTSAGQERLNQIQKRSKCLIICDKRTKKIHFYGRTSCISEAKKEINSFLEANGKNKEQIFKLKGIGKPPGLMKELMNQFGVTLDGLVTQHNLSSVSLNWKTHTLVCSGPETDIDAFENFMNSEEERLFQLRKEKRMDVPECVVCMDSVTTHDSMYRLEACGHAYCISCLKHQSMVCVQNNQFPLTCAGDGCEELFVWKDVRFIISKSWIKEEKLALSALNSTVKIQPDKFKFCPTPNCPVAYSITQNENGHEFNCPACYASICSTCHNPFHTGLNCHMARSANEAEKDLERWCDESRKTCPKCKVPIEKIEGCNKMRCESCRTVFCWICKAIFPDADKCYTHLAKEHGGIFG